VARGEQALEVGLAGDRRLPPIQPIAVAVIVLLAAGGIDIASYIPREAPRAPIIALLAAAGALLVLNAVLLARIEPFNWRVFRIVAGAYLIVYLIVLGTLEYVFVYDDTHGGQLVILTLMLLVFSLNLPLLLGFSVARFQAPE
jgi:hypothetical protein